VLAKLTSRFERTGIRFDLYSSLRIADWAYSNVRLPKTDLSARRRVGVLTSRLEQNALPLVEPMRTLPLLMLFLPIVAPTLADSGTFPAQGADDKLKSSQAEWMVVTPPAFRSPLESLIEKRRAEGLRVTIVETTNVLSQDQTRLGDGRPLAALIKERFGQGENPQYILLAGALRASDDTFAQRTVVPGISGTTGRMKGLASDYGYSLPDETGTPRVAVGRFPVRTVEEIQSMVQKTLGLEQACQPGPWRNRITLLQGNPGGGPLAETFVEQAASQRLQRLHPAWSLHAISHSSTSVYYLPTSRLHSTALDYLQSGQLFSIYMGHSDASGLWSNDNYFMSRDHWAKLRIQQSQGVFFTCGCFACEWSGAKGEGYGLAAMRNPGGPAAVIGACGESYSAPGLLAIDGFLRCCATPPFPARVADYWLAVQAGLAKGPISDGAFSLYDQFDGSGGKVPLSVQRREHLEMWMLLGDPALHLPVMPLDIVLDPLPSVSAGKGITVQGTLPDRFKGATVHISLERPVGSKPGDWKQMPVASPNNSTAREKAATDNHRKANDVVLVEADVKSNQARFELHLDLPVDLPWPRLVVRAYAASANEAAMGVEISAVTQ
jgi:hypothetical protein